MPCKTCGKVANLYIQLSLKHLEISRKSNRILASPSDTRGLKIQQDWFKGKSIGNHVTFNHEIWGGSCKCFPKKKQSNKNLGPSGPPTAFPTNATCTPRGATLAGLSLRRYPSNPGNSSRLAPREPQDPFGFLRCPIWRFP